ncbi:hypothetical protein T265_02621 [Opisthorchis viverrini]|uniref:HEAT repeat protein n=1 Tax=Opisthorchis viverrini TaxID=6198 RepID=A0A074ZYJ0_OPIVI|nr:hypothetical protein T265_02621 [Opisthorchis viverrini]KER31057.1 hypothetical protein T265_02621 [Opisthorchis viverrini]
MLRNKVNCLSDSSSEIHMHDVVDNLLAKLEALCRECRSTRTDNALSVLCEGLRSLSAHVRAKCMDVFAALGRPKLWLLANQIGDLVLWHTDDSDARVRERAFDCLRIWSVYAPEEITEPKLVGSSSRPEQSQCQNSTAQERLGWMKTNLDSVYASACRGLLDAETVVRRTSLLLVARLSTLWPHYELTDPLAMGLPFPSGSSDRVALGQSSCGPILMADDAFARICVRLQDPARQVRQLAVQLLSELANSVASSCLIQTLEKMVMTDRRVRRAKSDETPMTAKVGKRGASEPATGSGSIMSTGPSGAIISGLEDDYFEVRCATLATVTHLASLNTEFASGCQDLLVDMLTDDIQEVRLAAVCALGAVGDQVPLQSEQVAIITSALAESSGRIRRRLHQLLARCRLSSAPCLVSLLDGLLHNLRRYPQDRDSLWRCAASVGRRHPAFVETCLSSLLRTHSWLSGPEPNWEDPAYLTVLLLVLNAEPGAPGIPAKFPRHISATKVYLRELVPGLLPKRTAPSSDGPDDRVVPMKRLRSDSDGSCAGLESLCRFLLDLISRIVRVLTDIQSNLPNTTTDEGEATETPGKNEIRLTQKRYIFLQRRLSLLTRLVFTDLCRTVRCLDRTGQLNGLVEWMVLLSTAGWCLISSLLDPSPSSSVTSSDVVNESSERISALEVCPGLSAPQRRRISSLLKRTFNMVLKAEYLFIGKTKEEQNLVCQLSETVLSLIRKISMGGPPDYQLVTRGLSVLIPLFSGLIAADKTDSSVRSHSLLLPSMNRLFPVYVSLLQPSSMDIASDTARLHGPHHTLPAFLSAKLNDEADEGSIWTVPTHNSQSVSSNIIPEIRFTATIATASVRIRAIIIGLSLESAREHICVLFRRPDVAHVQHREPVNRHTTASGLHEWWPPVSSWHLLDEGLPLSYDELHPHTEVVERVELRAHMELTAGRWSDAGTVEIGLGYYLERSVASGQPTEDQVVSSVPVQAKHRIILPLTPISLFAKVRFVPSAPIPQW